MVLYWVATFVCYVSDSFEVVFGYVHACTSEDVELDDYVRVAFTMLNHVAFEAHEASAYDTDLVA